MNVFITITQVKEHSSSEDTVTSKKEKRECNPAAGIDDIVKQLSEEMARSMTKLNEARYLLFITSRYCQLLQSTTEDRNQLEYKLDQAEAKLDEANDKVVYTTNYRIKSFSFDSGEGVAFEV